MMPYDPPKPEPIKKKETDSYYSDSDRSEIKRQKTETVEEEKFEPRVYVSRRMIPPGDHQFFFSIAGK